MIRLLLLTAGTNAGYHIAKTLKEKYGCIFYIVGCDINKKWLIPTAPYIDAFYQCPYINSGSYYSFIIEVCKKEDIQYLLPSFDADQNLFNSDNEDLKDLDIVSFGLSKKVLNFYVDKIKTNQYLNSIGLPIPLFYLKDNLEDDFEYFVKPINGVGSIGAKRMRGKDIRKLVDENIIIQEICEEPEYTLECFNYNENLASIARERLGTNSGVCTKTRVFKDVALEKIAITLASSIKLPHIFNLQFMINHEGQRVITDVNLRTAGGMSLSYAAGWDEVSALAGIMMNLPETEILNCVSGQIKEQYVIRAYTDIVTKSFNKHVAFDLDGTLLDSNRRHEVLLENILKNYKYNISVEGLLSYKSNKHNNIEWLTEQGIPEEEALLINKEWEDNIETEIYLSYDTLYPDSIDVLKTLSRDNELYLLTARNNKEGLSKQILSLGIGQFFTKIIDVPSNTSSPDNKAKILSLYSIDTFVGDTEVDYYAADMSGCKFIASTFGFRSNFFWSNFNVEKIDNIKQVIGKILIK